MDKTNDYAGFLLEPYGRSVVLSFTRPEIRSPLSKKVVQELKTAFSGLENDENVASLVFTGSGNTFASGADLKEVTRLDKYEAYEFGKMGQDLMQMISRSRLETVAAINGFCMGGALDLALACDIRIASPDAVFAHPGVSLGIITGWGGTQMLPDLVGFKNAYDMFLTAKRIDATEALRIGLIDRIATDPVADAFEKAEEGK